MSTTVYHFIYPLALTHTCVSSILMINQFVCFNTLSLQVLMLVLFVLALGYSMGLYLSFGSHVEGKALFMILFC